MVTNCNKNLFVISCQQISVVYMKNADLSVKHSPFYSLSRSDSMMQTVN